MVTTLEDEFQYRGRVELVKSNDLAFGTWEEWDPFGFKAFERGEYPMTSWEVLRQPRTHRVFMLTATFVDAETERVLVVDTIDMTDVGVVASPGRRSSAPRFPWR